MVKGHLKPFVEYFRNIERTLAAGHATEGSHYPALKSLLESLSPGLSATSLPGHIECGAPDFVVTKGTLKIGYAEAKDVGKNLGDIEQGKGDDGKRFKRYLNALPNLVLTDFLEFRWYVDGQRRLSARLGTPGTDGKVKRDKEGQGEVAELLACFLSHEAQGVGTPKELAQRMARLAHMVRDMIIAALDQENETGPLHSQLAAFRDNLIPDLTPTQFADMYAQTIAYGLFAAKCAHPEDKNFTRQNAAYLLPKTNPFLRKLFNHIAGPDLDDRIAWLVDDLAQLLARADMASVLQDFGKRTAKEDPVVHFYETFLVAYDPRTREMRGVYYTPEPVVSYIVRSTDYLLKERFSRTEGLADKDTLILDPAVGTGTFLYDVIKLIHEGMQGQLGKWDGYVAERLLPRIFGFELLMAPYAVAHLKLGLLLQETGYQFQGDQRLGIYLTNTLEEAFKHSELLPGFNAYIVDEANEAAEIKKDKLIMVVLGNPPYSGISANASVREIPVGEKGKKRRELTWIGKLIEDYKQVDGKPLGERNPKWLQDDYVKFIRFGQWRIEQTGKGILGFITNHAYLDNPTFRGMRQSLMDTFTDIYILDLHGSAKKRETAPGGGKDKNVFDIQQGVAIGIFVKEPGKAGPARVHHADLWGLRGNWPDPQPGTKYHALAETDLATTEWVELHPTSPFYFFVPRNEELLVEYARGWKVTDIFPVNSVGVVTSRDHFVLDFDGATLRERITTFRDKALSDDEVRGRFGLNDKQVWTVSKARSALRQDSNWQTSFARCLYRPFDIRPIYYHDAVIERTRSEVMRHLLEGDNVALVCKRQSLEPQRLNYFSCSKLIVIDGYFAADNKGRDSTFPLYLYPPEQPKEAQPEPTTAQEAEHLRTQLPEERPPREANLSPQFREALSHKLGLRFIDDGRGDLEETFGPEDVFNYAYAVFHSPTYRSRYAEFLKIDFPRLPLTSDRQLFAFLAAKGAELASLHLMESPALSKPITKYNVPGSHVVEKVDYNEAAQRVYISKSQYFEAVPPEVWGFHIGGYQVCQKWLKDRKGRKLTLGEIEHYQKVVVALGETIRLVKEIDALIPSWPLE